MLLYCVQSRATNAHGCSRRDPLRSKHTAVARLSTAPEIRSLAVLSRRGLRRRGEGAEAEAKAEEEGAQQEGGAEEEGRQAGGGGGARRQGAEGRPRLHVGGPGALPHGFRHLPARTSI